jgi:hypothetical protein
MKKKSISLDNNIERQFSVILHSLLLKMASNLRFEQFCASYSKLIAFLRISPFTLMRPADCTFLFLLTKNYVYFVASLSGVQILETLKG